jgi:2-dehydro-3-deoxyphosphooctonate aldolase (KDO 8-P synthase)
MEIHDNPDVAPSDGPHMVPLAKLEAVLQQVLRVRASVETTPPVSL